MPVTALDADENKTIFLQSLRTILPQFKLLPDSRIEQRIGKANLQKLVEDVVGYVSEGVAQGLTRNEKFALYCKVLRCLSEHITSYNIPVTGKTVVDNIDYLGFAVGKHFPGYFEAKLLKWIIRPSR